MRAPLLWMAVCYCAGIGLSYSLTVSVGALFCCSAALLGVAAFSFLARRTTFSLIALSFVLVILGSASCRLSDRDFPDNHLRNLLRRRQLDLNLPCRISGRIIRDPVSTPFGYLLRLRLNRIENGRKVFAVTGDVRLAAPQEDSKEKTSIRGLEYGDRIDALIQLREPKGFRNPGVFDFAGQMRRDGIDLVGNIKSALLVEHSGPSPSWSLSGPIYRVRHRLLAEINRAYRTGGRLNARGAALEAILLGNRYFVDRSLEQDFQATGIYHVLVIAGLHVGIIAWFLLAVCRWCGAPRPASIVFTIGFLVAYAWMVEARTPVVRAVIMASTYLAASVVERDRSALNAIGLSAMMICLWRPQQVFDAGFQLSFASVLAIAAIGAPLVSRWISPWISALEDWEDTGRDLHLTPSQASFRVHLRFLAEEFTSFPMLRWVPVRWMGGAIALVRRAAFRVATLLVFSVAIQVSFTSFMAFYFNRVSLTAPFLNLLAIPLMGLIVPAGLVELAAAMISLQAANACAWVVSLALGWLISLSHLLASVEMLNLRVSTPPFIVQVGFVGCVAVLGAALTLNRKRVAVGAGIVALTGVGLIACSAYPPRAFPEGLSATFLDVGQGDSILIHFPAGQSMLIDGGGLAAGGFHDSPQEQRIDIGEDVVLPHLWWRRLRALDQVVLTHAHNDHIAGLIPIIKTFRVRELWVGNLPNIPPVQELMEAADRHHVKIRRLRAGDRMTLGASTLEILSAGQRAGVPLKPDDDDSLVMRIRYGRTDVVLTGDIGRAWESALDVPPTAAPSTTLLKVAHHGSKSATSDRLLDFLRPQFAVISVAKPSPFGHPSPEVLERLSRHRVIVFQTSDLGAIEAVSDERKWVIRGLMK